MSEYYDNRYSLIREAGQIGTGCWKAWKLGIEPIKESAEEWRKALEGVDFPWLCWNIDDEWCIVQQKLVGLTGWTAVVGCDTNVKQPTILPGSIFVDFNKRLKLPVMWMQFPLEFVYMFSKRLAFWHSDFLARISDMHRFADTFKKLKDGEMAVTWTLRGIFGLKIRKMNRIFELLGCTTEKASREQFQMGCGWWEHVDYHPNFRKEFFVKRPYYDFGTGVTIWHKKFGGRIVSLKPNERDGHASNYLLKHQPKKQNHRSKIQDMHEYYSLENIATKLRIAHLLS